MSVRFFGEEDVEHCTILVDGSSEKTSDSADSDEDFVDKKNQIPDACAAGA